MQLTETLKGVLVERKKEKLRKGWGEVLLWLFTGVSARPSIRAIFTVTCG